MNTRSTLLLLCLASSALLGMDACQGCTPTSVNEQVEATTHATSRTGISVELKLVRGQIDLYRRMNEGANPASLQDLETLSHLKYPDEYSYDPATGVVTAASYPEL